jgi:hypothetical protein
MSQTKRFIRITKSPTWTMRTEEWFQQQLDLGKLSLAVRKRGRKN